MVPPGEARERTTMNGVGWGANERKNELGSPLVLISTWVSVDMSRCFHELFILQTRVHLNCDISCKVNLAQAVSDPD